MIYIHESNLINKINSNYNNAGKDIKIFYDTIYRKYKSKLISLDYSSKNLKVFEEAANLIDLYLKEIDEFSTKHSITSQSKFRSTFIEEISVYLFKELSLIKDKTFGIFNKNIFAGLKINNHMHLDVITKDVDFCIGKKINITIDESQNLELIIPIACVEVKTYLDATMFGEVQYSSKQIKNASPNSKTYVLMEYNDVSKEKLLSARYDNIMNELFVLRSGTRKDTELSPLSANVLLQYYIEISNVVHNTSLEEVIKTPGRIINP